jgi:hypothetical protein
VMNWDRFVEILVLLALGFIVCLLLYRCFALDNGMNPLLKESEKSPVFRFEGFNGKS